MIRLFLLSTFAFILACGDQDSDSTFDAAGAFHLQNPDEFASAVKYRVTRNGQAISCTGTFVRPSVILTAAHCLVGSQGRKVANDEVTILTRSKPSVEQIYIDPAYLVNFGTTKALTYDMAWMKVALPLSILSDPRHLQSVREFADGSPSSGAMFMVVAYGMTIPGNLKSIPETPRRGYNTIQRIDDNFFVALSPTRHIKKGDVATIDKAKHTAILGGDSGAAALMNDRIIGVAIQSQVSFYQAKSVFINMNGPVGRQFLKSIPTI
jgi:secreted trypsin-like serine protease